MRKIYYWADGTWCDADEIGQFTHMSDDYRVVEVSWEDADDQVDKMVSSWVMG